VTGAPEIAQALFAAVQQVRHYGTRHPAAGQAASQFYRSIEAEVAHHAVQIEVEERTLTVQAVSLPIEDRQAAQLRAHLAARRIHRLTIERGARAAAVAVLIRLLALEPEELIAEGGWDDALRSAGASGITVESREARAPRRAVPGEDFHGTVVQTVHELTTAVEQGDPVDLPRARLAVEGAVAVLGVARQRLWQDLADRSHDELDPQHGANTCLLALFVAEALGCGTLPMTDVGVAALLHDLGLAMLPWELRLQERTSVGPQAQWRHPAEGAFVLRHLGGRESLPMIVAAEHHLPALGDAAVLPHARLVALADYADAMTCGRVPAMRRASMGGLLSELLAGGGPAFDPVHIRVLAHLLAQQAASGVEFTGRS
jgi:HD-GYP domain-containing protein (c-di-GMP phosphodiesterase class II)